MTQKGPYHDQLLVLAPTHNHLFPLRLYIASLMGVLDHRPDVHVVVLDDHSNEETRSFLSKLSHPRLQVRFLDNPQWKAQNINAFIQSQLSESNLPRVLFSIDADISFSPSSFDYLAQAAEAIPQLGMLSMRYVRNRCYPERNLFFPPKKFKGLNGQTYPISIPFLCNVAGGCIAIPGAIIHELGYSLYPKSEGKLRYPDDAFLYDLLKQKKKICGYLNGTLATHWRSADIKEY